MPEELKKSLGFWAVFALILTSMIGTSLFFGVSEGAKYAGVSSLFSWIFLGLITIYVAACFGELISMFPNSGGIYEFTKQAFGRFPSFLIGWIAWIVANMGAALLVVAALNFVLPGTGYVFFLGMALKVSFLRLFCAVAILVLFNFITYRGIQASGKLLMAFAFITLGLLVAIIAPGATHVHTESFTGLGFPVLAIFAAMFFLAESFFGWESASFLAEETVEPERTIPRALLAASTVVVLLSVLLAFVLLGSMPLADLVQDTNAVSTFGDTLFPHAAQWIAIGIFLTFIGGVVGGIVSSPRLLLALARDRLFIEQCAQVHPEYKTPVNAIIFQTVVTVFVVLIAFGEYAMLLSMLVPLALIMYAVVLLCIPVLRKKRATHPRPFKVWFGSVGPVLVALFYLTILAAWFVKTPGSFSTLTLIVGFIALAFPIYFFLTMIYNPDAIIALNNISAKINYALEDFLFPRHVRQEIIDLFKGSLRGKEIVEFGSGVGTFTMHLAEEAGPKGNVVAIDLSRVNLDILARRIEQKGHMQVRLIHDEHQVSRLHPDIKHADIIYSVGFLGYVQDLPKVLREMHSILGPSGKICFVEYTNFFKILPDPAIVSDTVRLEQIFREAGFSVNIHKRKALLWNYLVIHGIKAEGKNVAYI